jgi:hypothetical protein
MKKRDASALIDSGTSYNFISINFVEKNKRNFQIEVTAEGGSRT